jgi:hypothetical protein
MNKPEEKEKLVEVIFTNQPKLSKHEEDKTFNERRTNLVPQIKEFVSTSRSDIRR